MEEMSIDEFEERLNELTEEFGKVKKMTIEYINDDLQGESEW